LYLFIGAECTVLTDFDPALLPGRQTSTLTDCSIVFIIVTLSTQ